MVRAYHLIFTAYGFWLPNDPRGSWSDFVRSWRLLRFGPATKVNTRRSVAHVKHDRQQRLAARSALRYHPVRFNGLQARAVGRAFAAAQQASGYTFHACAILPDHVHLVLARHHCRAEQIARRLKQVATQRLVAEELHPLGGQASPWARGCWKVYLNDAADVRRAIRYVEANPGREGLRAQKWSFVTPFGE